MTSDREFWSSRGITVDLSTAVTPISVEIRSSGEPQRAAER
jgi:hypothetical protein